MARKMIAMVTGLVALGLAGTATAIPVDLELSLVIDSSSSIDNVEFNQQISGYAQAFQKAPIIQSIVDAPDGVAINTILFAGSATEVIPFTHLETATDVANFVADLQAITRTSGGTNIPSGIDLAVDRIANNGFESGNIIIDVSGDGTSSPFGTRASRDAALLAGVTRINGLAIQFDSVFDFYQNNVIAGPDSFVLKADSFAEFGEAIATKLSIELGAPDPTSVPEPGVVSMLGFGLLAFGFAVRRRNKF